jgi:hypothetical protein
MIDGSRYARNTQAFTIPVEPGARPEDIDKNFDTTWVKSPHGAYLLVRTELPLNYQGTMQNYPGYAVMFSQHPAFLADLFLRRGEEGVAMPSKKEIEAKLTVVSARYEHDILQKNPKTGDEHIVTAWMKTSIDRHTATTGRLLKRHGSAIKEGESLYRSGSSVLWVKPTKKNPEEYDCYYYGNPIFGTVSLFVNETMLESFGSKLFFKSSAIKLNKTPLNKEQAHELAHKEFTVRARQIMRLEDPYDLDSSARIVPKILRGSKKIILRTLQKVTHAVANINLKALFVSTGVTGFLVLAFQVPALMFAASAGKSNLLAKGAQSLGRMTGKFLSPVSTLTVNALNDVAALVASHVKNNYVTDEVRGLIANPHYVDHMYAMPRQFMPTTYPEIVSYDQGHEREWARAVILDSLGIQPGTIFSEIELEGRDFLLAQQPNGLDIYYDPEEHVAFARQARDAYEYTCLEKPIQLLLNELTPRKKIIGVKLGKEGEIQQRNFVSIERIPKEFDKSRAKSVQALRAAGFDVNSFTSGGKFPLVDILPPHERKTLIKKSQKEFTSYLKTAFDDGAVLDDGTKGPVTVNDNIDAYILQRSSDNPGCVSIVFGRKCKDNIDAKLNTYQPLSSVPVPRVVYTLKY